MKDHLLSRGYGEGRLDTDECDACSNTGETVDLLNCVKTSKEKFNDSKLAFVIMIRTQRNDSAPACSPSLS
jgi:hypothetical protein